MRFFSYLAVSGVLCILPPDAAFGQQKPLLPADDPRLYQMFFNFYDKLSQLVQDKKTHDPVRGAQLEKSIARLHRVGQIDLPKLGTVAHGFATDNAKWGADLRDYVDQAKSKGQEPNAAEIEKFEKRKQQLIDQAVKQLSTTLSPSSWAGLRGYLNDEYRPQIRLTQPSSLSLQR